MKIRKTIGQNKHERAISILMELEGLSYKEANNRLNKKISVRIEASTKNWNTSDVTQFAEGVAEALEEFKKSKLKQNGQ